MKLINLIKNTLFDYWVLLSIEDIFAWSLSNGAGFEGNLEDRWQEDRVELGCRQVVCRTDFLVAQSFKEE